MVEVPEQEPPLSEANAELMAQVAEVVRQSRRNLARRVPMHLFGREVRRALLLWEVVKAHVEAGKKLSATTNETNVIYVWVLMVLAYVEREENQP